MELISGMMGLALLSPMIVGFVSMLVDLGRQMRDAK